MIMNYVPVFLVSVVLGFLSQIIGGKEWYAAAAFFGTLFPFVFSILTNGEPTSSAKGWWLRAWTTFVGLVFVAVGVAIAKFFLE